MAASIAKSLIRQIPALRKLRLTRRLRVWREGQEKFSPCSSSSIVTKTEVAGGLVIMLICKTLVRKDSLDKQTNGKKEGKKGRKEGRKEGRNARCMVEPSGFNTERNGTVRYSTYTLPNQYQLINHPISDKQRAWSICCISSLTHFLFFYRVALLRLTTSVHKSRSQDSTFTIPQLPSILHRC